jgi:hypothetical protein
MPAQRIGSLLATGGFRALSSKAQHLTELQQVFSDSAPPSLAHAARVSDCRAGTLFLVADNAAVAAKLRQLTPRLLVKFRKRGFEVTGIQLEVQVKGAPSGRQPERDKNPLSAEIVENFRKLSETIPPSNLKSALIRLVRRHGQRS